MGESQPQPVPVVELSIMDDPPTPKQESHDMATRADTTPKAHLRPHPLFDISITGPTTLERQEHHYIPTQAGSTPNTQPVVNVTIASPATPEKQKSPGVSIPFDANSVYLSELRPSVLLNLIVELVVQKAPPVLRERLVHCSLVLGSTRIYHMDFNPTVSEIRAELFLQPDASTEEMIDATVDVMIEAWENRCRRAIDQYSRDMRRDLLGEVRDAIKAVKGEVLEAAEKQLEGRLQAFRINRPSKPAPATPSVDVLIQVIQNFSVSRRSERSPAPSPSPSPPPSTPLKRPLPYRSPRVKPTKPTLSPTAPIRFQSPRPSRHTSPSPRGNRRTGTPGGPTGTPGRPHTPVAFERSGNMGRHDVYTPTHHSMPPPAFKLEVEDTDT
ncbi:hypothetical protein E0Z10_g1836 [Xylaria hypoxylon]|uniref:Uncharacterized protein n=1 Tax=Xylaria hypoxylon TaxID=37992 RepID=A0A4Z0Z644_9PEZI|nr:hypothetical protein E0Z10_g1836 [Xylaria hypoxylon]